MKIGRPVVNTREMLLAKKRKYAREYRINNLTKMKEYDAKRYAENPRKKIASSCKYYQKNRDTICLRKVEQYGMSVIDYKVLLMVQNEACAICKNTCVSGRRLAVDHNHVTGRIRGLLCSNCNTALGKFKDSSSLLAEAIRYLEKGSA